MKFVLPPHDTEERGEHFASVFNDWFKKSLRSGEYVPRQWVKVLEGGLGAVQAGLDELKRGVSGVKLVVEV